MKLSLPLALIACATVIANAQVTLNFTNGDSFSGTVGKGTTEQIELKSEILANPAQLSIAQLRSWDLNRAPTPFPISHSARLELNKGGTLFGELVELDKDSVTLKSDYAGQLEIDRRWIDSLTIEPRENFIYYGPLPLAKWNLIDGAWTPSGQAIRSSQPSTIARNLDFPEDTFALSWTLSWTSSPQFHISFLADSTEVESPQNAYELSFRRQRVFLQKHWVTENGNQDITPIGEIPLRRLLGQQNQRLNCELQVNRVTGEINFIVNDILVAQWRDPSPASGSMGNGIVIQSHNDPTALQDLNLSHWNGLTRDISGQSETLSQPTLTDEETEKGYQIINLQNEDSVIGNILSLDSTAVLVETSSGELSIPIVRLKSVALRPFEENEYDEAILQNGDVTGHYPDGSILTFRLDEVDGLQAKASSQNFGTIDLDLSVFTRIDFNLYDHAIMLQRRSEKSKN